MGEGRRYVDWDLQPKLIDRKPRMHRSITPASKYTKEIHFGAGTNPGVLWMAACVGMTDIHQLCRLFNNLIGEQKSGERYMNKRCLKFIGMGLLLIGLITFAGIGYAAEVMLIGEINDTQQLVAENQIYEVGPGELGDYLVTKLISVKVKVYGDLIETDGIKTIVVKQYELMQE